MRTRYRYICCLMAAACLSLTGCTSLFTPQATVLPESAVAPTIPESQLVEISVLMTSESLRKVPKNSRIVIADIGGPCANELKNALMRRLVDNAQYDVLSRDHLQQILFESTQQWAGSFNSRTAIQLGELLGASIFLVGDVIYCGNPYDPHSGYASRTTHATYNADEPYDIFAVLQIVDIKTGKVILSTANEGSYLSEASPLLFSAKPEEYARLDREIGAAPPPKPEQIKAAQRKRNLQRAGETTKNLLDRLFKSAGEMANNTIPEAVELAARSGDEGDRSSGKNEGKKKKEEINYPAFKAAEDLANGFADKFFARPIWANVEMWSSSYWRYGDSIRHVKLGNCPIAAGYLETTAAKELSEMPDKDVAEYLHNYGVALLCANRTEQAIEKLQSAYRIGYHPSTLRMLGLASQVQEWKLHMKIDKQPEIDLILKRSAELAQN